MKGISRCLKGIFREDAYIRSMYAEFRLKRGAELPLHSPLHEQTGYLISGSMILNIRIEVNEMREEDSRVIPGNVTHRATILADSVAVEIFSPVRDDYLPE